MVAVQDTGVVPTLTAADRTAAFQELAKNDISHVIVGPMQRRAEMVALLTDVFGRPPEETGGVQVWRDVQR